MRLPTITQGNLDLVISRMDFNPINYLSHIYKKIKRQENLWVFNDDERTNFYVTGPHIGVYELLDLSLPKGLSLPIVTPLVRRRVLEEMCEKKNIARMFETSIGENPLMEDFLKWLGKTKYGGLLDSLKMYELLRLQAEENGVFG